MIRFRAESDLVETLRQPKGGLKPSDPEALSVLAKAHIHSEPFIGGRFVESKGNGVVENICPVNGKIINRMAMATATDIDLAVSAARTAADKGAWAKDGSARKRVLHKLADLIESNIDEIAMLDAIDVGKPWPLAKSIDVTSAVATFRWYAELIDKVYGEIAPTAVIDLLRREPIGVVGAVTPWNYPTMIAAWKIAPMLAAGNCVVHKPAEQSPLSALRIGELAAEAGIPEGVLNVVPGDGPSAGAALGKHMRVGAIGFTGSSEVGKLFLCYSGQSNMKVTSLECGGKSPTLIFPDANLDNAISSTASGIFYNAGQSCNAPTRLLVHSKIYKDVLDRIVRASKEYVPNNPLASGVGVGAIVNREQFDQIVGFIERSKKVGAEVIVGGRVLYAASGGYYIEPTIITKTRPEMEINQEEVFGPVLPITTFDSFDEAISLANDSRYGLWANVWTNNLDIALAAARLIQAGTVAVNTVWGGDISTPMGGFKESGIGRDRGIEAFNKYTQLKHISLVTPS